MPAHGCNYSWRNSFLLVNSSAQPMLDKDLGLFVIKYSSLAFWDPNRLSNLHEDKGMHFSKNNLKERK